MFKIFNVEASFLESAISRRSAPELYCCMFLAKKVIFPLSASVPSVGFVQKGGPPNLVIETCATHSTKVS